MMQFTFSNLSENDRIPVIDIFNYYLEHSCATYPLGRVDYSYFSPLMERPHGYPGIAVRDSTGEVIGFAFMKAHREKVATVSYFIKPEHTRKGIGKAILDRFIEEARASELDLLSAGMTSLNEISLNFHMKNGFTEYLRLRNIGRKFNSDFDEIWMERKVS